jgi:hypothetical protein
VNKVQSGSNGVTVLHHESTSSTDQATTSDGVGVLGGPAIAKGHFGLKEWSPLVHRYLLLRGEENVSNPSVMGWTFPTAALME